MQVGLKLYSWLLLQDITTLATRELLFYFQENQDTTTSYLGLAANASCQIRDMGHGYHTCSLCFLFQSMTYIMKTPCVECEILELGHPDYT